MIVPKVVLPWRTIDLSLLNGGDREQRLAGILVEDRAERFDLASAPLIRAMLIRLSADEHRLVLSHHHVVMDGWSTGVLAQELLTLYAHKGDAGALPPVTPYRDYLAWVAEQDRVAARTAWRESLAGLEEGTQLASHDRARVPIAPEQVALDLDEGLTGALVRRRARRSYAQHTCPGGVGAPAWTHDRARRRGVRRHRRRPDAGDCRRRDDGGPVHQYAAAADQAAGEQVAACAPKGRARHPVAAVGAPASRPCRIQNLVGLGELFDTLVVFENYPIDRERLSTGAGGLRLVDVSILDATHYPLSLMAIPGEQLKLRLEYRPDLFDRAAIAAMADRLLRLLEAAVADSDRAIGGIDILAPDERHTILHGWNDTARVVPSSTLPELFAAQVARTPDAIAVVFEEQTLSYAELDARANQLAHHLRDLGVGPEIVVGLCVERSPAMLVGLFGILKAGGAYLPLDPSNPPERLAFMLEDTHAPLLLTHSMLVDGLPTHAARLVCLDVEAPAIARRPLTVPTVALDPRHRAYVIYTSGSTGTPKGVAVEHASLVNKLSTLAADFGVGPGFRIAHLTSCGFDPSIEQATLALVHGGSVVIIGDAIRENLPVSSGTTWLVPRCSSSTARHPFCPASLTTRRSVCPCVT